MTTKAAPAVLDLKEFYAFCSDLQVETKEQGIISLGQTFLGSQRFFFEEVSKGLSEGVHYFVVLKGRQLGISTACLALDLYWHFKYPGTQGTLATDTEENREMFRSTLTMYMESLPVGWRAPVEQHNRTQLVLGNRSRMVYQVAGTRKNVGFGAGKAISFVHATEVGKWGDGTDISSFEASLAETNPLRLYIWESTAYGFNAFQEMWETAETAITQRAIFIGWWRNHFYRVRENDPDTTKQEIFRVYWDGKKTEDEKRWTRDVKELYGIEISPAQLAWHRWTLNEKMKGDEQMMHEKYPPTPEYAFVMSGSQFFSAERINDQFKRVRAKPFESYRFTFGPNFEDTELVTCAERTTTLKIWRPVEPNSHYSIGADPAWGSSEWADRFAISVNQCWADGIEQVAEFCTDELSTMQFAWVLLYLAAYYGDQDQRCNVMMNLELNGPGMAVWSEVQQLRNRASLMREHSKLARLLLNIQNFLYRRQDVIGGSFAFHTKTTAAEKDRMLNIMKDNHEMGTHIINSTECLREMKNVVREDGVIGAPGRGKDDRVIADALSVLAWQDLLRVRLIQGGVTRVRWMSDKEKPRELVQTGRTVQTYLRAIGIKTTEQQEAERQAKIAQQQGR